MRVFKCDRCGTYYDEWNDTDNQPFIVKIHGADKNRFNLADLCVPCYNELNKFMREKDEKGG